MQNYVLPSVDEQNPLYCPAFSAASYLASLRQLRRSSRSRTVRSKELEGRPIFRSFAHILIQTCLQDGSDQLDFNNNSNSQYSLSAHPSSLDIEYYVPSWEREGLSTFTPENLSGDKELFSKSVDTLAKRKRTFFGDTQGPAKYARSQSVHGSSSKLRIKREKPPHSVSSTQTMPRFIDEHTFLRDRNQTSSPRGLISNVRAIEDDLYQPLIGTESPRSVRTLINRLESVMPGIRLKERLSNLNSLTHQSITDFLADNGHLSARVLDILRTSAVQSVSLTASLNDENGLNLSGEDILPVFSKPNSFLFLSELSLSGSRIQDFDLVHIHHLPRLAILCLTDTGIGNEASVLSSPVFVPSHIDPCSFSVFLLTALKHTLAQLSIASNPDVDSDAVTALLLLSKLSFLSILGTSIEMAGLRRLSKTIYHERRIIEVEIPYACEQYIDNMGSHYLLSPPSPFIVDPDACAQLSATALKRNLTAHATSNPDIIAAGTKAEMLERLHGILTTRKADLLVRAMIRGSEWSLCSDDA